MEGATHMNKKNKMSMWSIGLGSAFMMMMLASHEDTQNGHVPASHIASKAISTSSVSLQAGYEGLQASHQLTPEMIQQLLSIVTET